MPASSRDAGAINRAGEALGNEVQEYGAAILPDPDAGIQYQGYRYTDKEKSRGRYEDTPVPECAAVTDMLISLRALTYINLPG